MENINDLYRIKIAVMDTGFNLSNKEFDKIKNYSKDVKVNYKDCSDRNNHGTMITSLIAGEKISLTQDKVYVYNVKTFNEDGKTKVDNVIKSLEWCLKSDVEIINMSLGMNFYSRRVVELCYELDKQNKLVVVSSGNEYDKYPEVMMFPANLPCTISVGSIDKKNEISSFSQRGFGLDILTYGENVLVINKDGGYERIDGTSFACAKITSLLAHVVFNLRISKMLDFEVNKANIMNYLYNSNLVSKKGDYYICTIGG